MFRQLFNVMAPCLLGMALCCASSADDGAGGPRLGSVQIGYQDTCKVGYWSPVRVEIVGGVDPSRVRLELTAPDADGVPARFTTAEDIDLPAQESTHVEHYVKIGRVNCELTVTIFDGDVKLDERSLSLRGAERKAAAEESGGSSVGASRVVLSTQTLIVSIGPDIGVDAAAKQLRRPVDQQIVTTRVDDVRKLPKAAVGYDTIDVLVVATSTPEIIDMISDEQLDAIDDWTRQGGRLILCVGAQGEHVIGSQGRLRRFAPGRFTEVVVQRRSPGLETYAGASTRLDAGAADFGMHLTLMEEVDGVVEASEGLGGTVRPTLIRRGRGFGEVLFAAIDLDQPPFTQWQDRARLTAKLIAGAANTASLSDEESSRGSVAHLGYEDMSGQLRAALDQFSGITLIGFSWVAAVLVVYGLLIGPGDYLFLRRVVGRMEWTWVTFPLLVLVFSGLAVALAYGWKGHQIRVNQVDVIDLDAQTSTVRGAHWSHIYSPRNQVFNLELQPDARAGEIEQSGETLFCWQGLPGRGLGGMNTDRPPMVDASYRVRFASGGEGRSTSLEQIPIQVWSTKSLAAHWWADSDLEFQSNLHRRLSGLIGGDFENPLDVELTDCYLIYDRWAYFLDRLPPQANKQIKLGIRPLDFRWRLTRRQVDAENREISTRWDRANLEIPRILQLMMFHEAAGGQNYTKLTHGYERRLDLSRQLRAGRAVLVGRANRPASRILRDGVPLSDKGLNHWSFYRIIFPVAPRPPK